MGAGNWSAQDQTLLLSWVKLLVDDSVPNLKAFTGQGIVFTAPHNALDTDFPRVNRWLDVADYFEVTETFG